MRPAISVQGVSRHYRRYHADRPWTWQEALVRGWRFWQPAETFWALRDVSIEIAPGRMVGVIGHNGAGKSTLLRLIGGVGRPDTGRIEVHGRVGALLDIGAGFHHELTGRENVMIGGVVSGLTKAEVVSRFDEIVRFAELESFIENPLRTYSSGMVMRLAFAVAAHIEPEVLLIDEVLSVGDIAFQEKSLQRIREFKARGCTIVLVSHNTDLVAQLCDEVVWLRGGRLVATGPAAEITAAYVSEMSRLDAPAPGRPYPGEPTRTYTDGSRATRASQEQGDMPTADEAGLELAAADAQPAAAAGESRTEEQQVIAELTEANTWLEQQLASWQETAEERDGQIRELEGWIGELEEAKTWLDEQRLAWQTVAERHEQVLERATRDLEFGEENPAVALDRLQQTLHDWEPEAAPSLLSRSGRLVPFSQKWGLDRGLPIDRYYIEGFLCQRAADIRGQVLEIGDKNDTLRFRSDADPKGSVLDGVNDVPGLTRVANLAQSIALAPETFDCIIFTQSLQLIYDARAAVSSLWRLLKPGGTLLLTCPGLTAISQLESPGSWYWRLTATSIGQLLQDAVPGVQAEVNSYGNVLAACAFLYGLAVEDMRREDLDYHDRNYEVILAVRAVK